MPPLFTNRSILLLCLGLVTFTLILRQLQPYLTPLQPSTFSPPSVKRAWTCQSPSSEPGYPSPHQRPKKRVAIIGAGSAGSSAAYYLRNFTGDCYDLTIDVFERNDYIGGRSTTVDVFDDPAAGITAELGGSIFVEVNHNLVAAARRFGLKTTVASFEARQQRRGADKPKSKGKGRGRGRGTNNDDDEDANDRFGVWDGARFVFTQPANESYWRTVLRMLWRYGLAPVRTQSLMRSTVGAFLKLYEPPYFPFTELSEAVAAVGLTNATAQTGAGYLEANGIAPPFSTDLIQASTRVNYAQNLGQIHGVETMVCMATEGAMAVEGGNWRIFEAMLVNAEAAVHLNNTVTAISAVRDDGKPRDGKDVEGHDGYKYEITVADSADTSSPSSSPSSSSSSHTQTLATRYDDVILAGPYQFSDLTLPDTVTHAPDAIEYVQLHVTLFTTPYRLQPSYFGLNQSDDVPGTILTTLPDNAQCVENDRAGSRSDAGGGGGGGETQEQGEEFGSAADTTNTTTATTAGCTTTTKKGPSDFLSISTLARVTNPYTQEDEYLYKIFSHQPVRAGLLQRLFLGTQIPADKAAGARVAATAAATGGRSVGSDGNAKVQEEAKGEGRGGGQGGGQYDPEVGPGVEDGVTAWRHVKVWHSYPYLPPRVTFEEPVLAPGLWYTAGIESFISTMETSSLMGMNVAALAVERWQQLEKEASSAADARTHHAQVSAPSKDHHPAEL